MAPNSQADSGAERDHAERDHAVHDGAERRSRLRQYQVQLLDRMQVAKTNAADHSKQLGVMIGQTRCLLDMTEVGEIAPVAGISKVPLAQDWYLGLANIRGNLTGIIDLARYRGEPTGMSGSDSRIITFAPGLAFNCALLVGRVFGLRKPDDMAPDVAAAGAPAWSDHCFRDSEGQRWTRIDLSLLVQETRFLHVGF